MVVAGRAHAQHPAGQLGLVGGRRQRVGGVGAGHAVKALNNLLSATHLLSTAEVMAAGQRFGLDPQVMIDVFNRSSGQSRSTSSKWPDFVLPGAFNSGFALPPTRPSWPAGCWA